MDCPSEEIIVAFVAGELDVAQRRLVEPHFNTCSSCRVERQTIESLRTLSRSRVLDDPPPWTLNRAASIPQDLQLPGFLEVAGRIATLLVDTLRDPLPQGARTAAAQGRQMLYHALDYDIDVRILPSSQGKARIAGQVLPGPDRPIESAAGLDVVLSRPGDAHVCVTNELGEFSFAQVAEGEWSLQIEAAEDRLIIERVPVVHS